jgi:hypothetical protein
MRILRIAVAAALAAGTVVGGVALSAAPAMADIPGANQITFQSQYFWSGGFPAIGTVSCPSGYRVVSSGAAMLDNPFYGQVDSIAPDINTFTSVTATGTGPGYLQVTAGCEPAYAMTTEVTTRTISLPYGSGFRRGVVYCPAGMHAFGGGGYFAKPFGIQSTDGYGMVSDAVSADGTGWTFAASTRSVHDSLVITTQCAPLRGSYVSQTSAATAPIGYGAVYGSCQPGYTALSGGVYLSRRDGNEVVFGWIDYSIPASGNRWYVSGVTGEDSRSNKLVALEQCIR